jgi:hypothetical protein
MVVLCVVDILFVTNQWTKGAELTIDTIEWSIRHLSGELTLADT